MSDATKTWIEYEADEPIGSDECPHTTCTGRMTCKFLSVFQAIIVYAIELDDIYKSMSSN